MQLHLRRAVVLLLIPVILVCEAAMCFAAAPAVGKYGMLPIYGRDIVDGTYDIAVQSSSSFFKVIHASVTVSGDSITASITIGSHSYPYVFPGTKQEAAQAPEAQWITPLEDEDSAVFTFSIPALNTPVNCAAYSKRRKKWYDRQLLFDASSLPKEALRLELPDYDRIEAGLAALAEANGEETPTQEQTPVYGLPGGSGEAMEVPYEDGEYSIEVSMTGGTGRAAISSPTLMVVEDGRAYAKLLWSSPHYDWLAMGGQTYYNENTDGGNSYFMVPIPEMDRIIEIVADTTAMGDPVAISYSLTFYADTIGGKGLIPQEAAKKVIILAAAIIVAGAVLNYFLKKKRKNSA